MTTENKTLPEGVPATACSENIAFCLCAAFSLPIRGKRLTVVFNVSVACGDKPTG
ncbi:MAG: hypothetical protein K2Q23_09535 [Bryobacteraceae bacterium]|nr:hypothetical protein [Bryobacteraceae bacterium]